MSVTQPSVAKGAGVRWTFWALVLTIGLGAGTGLALLSRNAQQPSVPTLSRVALRPAASWAKGARPAPDFRLTDQNGGAFSLRSLRGRPVLVTFIDPLCRNLCPLEAKVLSDVVRRAAPADRPAIAAVSVNPSGDTPRAFRQDAVKWELVPQWRWGIGSHAALARVWRDYEIGVSVAKRTIVGITVHEVSHTEATYVVDATGHERAVFVYPFRAVDVLRTLRHLRD